MDLDAQRKGKCAVIKTSTRQVCKLGLRGAPRDNIPVIVRYMYTVICDPLSENLAHPAF